jgi:hypothetical protein
VAKIHDIAESLGQPLDDDGVVGHGRRWCHILQQFGLSPGELRALPHDRRVKAVVLTPLGSSTKRELLTRLHQPPDDFLALDQATLEDLRDALAQLPASLRAPGPHERPPDGVPPHRPRA